MVTRKIVNFPILGVGDAGLIITHPLIITIWGGEGNPRIGVGKLWIYSAKNTVQKKGSPRVGFRGTTWGGGGGMRQTITQRVTNIECLSLSVLIQEKKESLYFLAAAKKKEGRFGVFFGLFTPPGRLQPAACLQLEKKKKKIKISNPKFWKT